MLNWFEAMAEICLDYHPDDDPFHVVDSQGRVFTDEEAKYLVEVIPKFRHFHGDRIYDAALASGPNGDKAMRTSLRMQEIADKLDFVLGEINGEWTGFILITTHNRPEEDRAVVNYVSNIRPDDVRSVLMTAGEEAMAGNLGVPFHDRS